MHCKKITNFAGEYDFLSWYYPTKVVYQNVLFPTVYHAFKSLRVEDARTLINIPNLSISDLNRLLTCYSDLKIKKEDELAFLKGLLIQKFSSTELKEKLIKTADAEIVYHSEDAYFGVNPITNEGDNELGKLLMIVRKELMNEQ